MIMSYAYIHTVVDSCCLTRSHVFLLFLHFIIGSVSDFKLSLSADSLKNNLSLLYK